VQMSCPEEVDQIFSAQQLFQVEGKHLDIWEPPETQNTHRYDSPRKEIEE
jgi:hypothetical protein